MFDLVPRCQVPRCPPLRYGAALSSLAMSALTISMVSRCPVPRFQTETSIRHSRRPRGQLLRHALRLPCIRCGRPKGMEPAAGAFTDTRVSRPLQDGIEDLSSHHPMTVPNC